MSWKKSELTAKDSLDSPFETERKRNNNRTGQSTANISYSYTCYRTIQEFIEHLVANCSPK